MLAAVSEAVMMANFPLPPRTRAALSIRVWPIPSGVAWLTKKSRASGSASASQVMTLMPRWRALRSTEEIPSRFSTATAITSTPRVIQVSIDLVLLGRVGVGRAVPDQLDAQLLRRLLGPLAAGDEVGVPLALGHHRHGDLRCGIGLRRRPRGGRRDRRPAGSTPASSLPERPHQVDVARRDDQRRRQDAGAEHGHLRILHDQFSLMSRWEPAPAARVRPGRRSSPIASSRSVPGQDAGQLGRQVGEPQAILKHGDGEQAEQRPDDAPATAEDRRAAQHHGRDRQQLVARAGVGLGLAEVGHVDDRREARRPAPRAGRPAPIRRSTGSPAYRAPSGEKPIATRPRPSVVRWSKSQNAAATTAKIGNCVGTSPKR